MSKSIASASLLAIAMSLSIAQQCSAAVTQEEANRLKTDLTPMGAEKAGNKDGSIPAWDGGYSKIPAGFKQGDPRQDPFANEKPVLSINASNMEKYSDRLSEGVKHMMK